MARTGSASFEPSLGFRMHLARLAPLLVVALGFLPLLQRNAMAQAEGTSKAPAKIAIGVPAAGALPAIKAKASQNGQALELAQIIEGFDGKLVNALAGTRKFDVRAHSDLRKILDEQSAQDSGNYDLADPARAKAFKLSGIPYLAIVEITDFQDQVQTATFEGIGAKATRRQIRLSASCRIMDTTKGTMLESVNLTVSDMDFKNNPDYVVDQKGGDLTEAVINVIADRMAADVAARVTDVIFPAKIVALTNGRASINRGDGTGIAAGQVWEVFAVGEGITDPDTGEVLGADEIPVGFIKVLQVEAKLARAEPCGENRGIAKDCIVRRTDRKDCGSAASGPAQPAQMIASPSVPNPMFEEFSERFAEVLEDGQAQAARGSESTESVPSRVAAIFVRNREPKIDDSRVAVLEDFLVAGLDDTCFTTMSREDCLNAVSKFAREGANAGKNLDPAKDLDRLLSDQTSALRLAQSMGADYVLIASITALSVERRVTDDAARGIKTEVTTSTLDATFRILGRAEGRVLASGSAMASDAVRQAPGLKVERDIVTGLLRESAAKMAEAMRKRCEKKGIASPDALSEATIEITGTPSDLAVPEIVKDAAGNWVVSSGRYQLEATSFAIELDGIVVGTTPSPVRAAPGLHKIRVTRPDFEPYEATVNIGKGTTPLVIPMKATPEGLARWRDMSTFFQALKKDQQLTEAQVKVLNGYAEYLKNSKFSIEEKTDIKVDTKEAPVFQERSFWPGVVVQER